MWEMIYKTIILTLSVTLSYGLRFKNSECKANNPCVCLYSNQLAINLTALQHVPGNFSIAGNNKVVYFYQPCVDVPVNQNEPEKKALLWLFTASNASNLPLDATEALEGAINGTMTPLATSAFYTYQSTFLHMNTAKISYRLNSTLSEVVLECTETPVTSLTILPPENEIQYRLQLSGKLVCAGVESKHLSVGSVLVILFFTGSLIYLVGGALLLKYLRGAEGLEMIPNLEFWRELPALVKDGIVFALSCGRVRPASYEAI